MFDKNFDSLDTFSLDKIDFKYIPYSYSRMSTYLECPRRFKFHYIDNVPEEYDQFIIMALAKGSKVHALLEKYPKIETESKSYDIVEKFIRSPVAEPYVDAILNEKPNIREYPFGLTKDFECTDYDDINAIFHGKIDLITTVNDRLTLVDYKTGKAKEQSYQNYSQLMLYGIYFFQKTSVQAVQEIDIAFVYVEHDHENTLTLKREYLEHYKDMFRKIVYKIENDEVFEKNEKNCKFCPYAKHCEIEKLNENQNS